MRFYGHLLFWNTRYHMVFQWAVERNYLQNVVNRLLQYNNCMFMVTFNQNTSYGMLFLWAMERNYLQNVIDKAITAGFRKQKQQQRNN